MFRPGLSVTISLLVTCLACSRSPKEDAVAGKETPLEGRSPISTATPMNGSSTETSRRVGPRLGGDASIAPSSIGYVEMKVVLDETTGDPKEDTFRFLKIWGELTNKSSEWVEQLVGDIHYLDADGKELAVDSIGAAVKRDLGDQSSGERIHSEVMYIAPGASVPMHHIRALGKLGGKYRSHRITLRPARIISKHPEGVFVSAHDEVATVPNDSIGSKTPNEHRVLSGTITNKGDLGCRKPSLVVGYYDEAGKLAALDEGDAMQDANFVLRPGASIAVKVFTLVGFENAWKAKAKFRTWVSCSEPQD